jgi:SAM-dependent methyltransferase
VKGRNGPDPRREGPVWRTLRRACRLVRHPVRGWHAIGDRTFDVLVRLCFRRFDQHRPIGTPRESAELVAQTDALNLAAEQYFVSIGETPFLTGKPFTDGLLPRYLYSLGILLEGIRLHRSDVVVELGAGTSWVSHFINRYGCKTISVDVSGTALTLAEKLFRQDSTTNWAAGPEFRSYDGHRLPLADASCTKVVIFDAFHHVPNQREILSELARILTPDGIVGMCEPGLGHASSESSRAEVENHGVLENELVIEDLGALAKDCGFSDARVIVAPHGVTTQVDVEDLGAFLRGRGFRTFWQDQCTALLTGHFILLYKGDPTPTTRQPTGLDARIRVGRGQTSCTAVRGRPTPLVVHLTNMGPTRWLARDEPGGGWTRLGAHLYRDEPHRELVDFDWLRVALPETLGQNQEATIPVELPPVPECGRYRVVFDLVIEGYAWFAQRGSRAAELTLTVTEPQSA